MKILRTTVLGGSAGLSPALFKQRALKQIVTKLQVPVVVR